VQDAAKVEYGAQDRKRGPPLSARKPQCSCRHDGVSEQSGKHRQAAPKAAGRRRHGPVRARVARCPEAEEQEAQGGAGEEGLLPRAREDPPEEADHRVQGHGRDSVPPDPRTPTKDKHPFKLEDCQLREPALPPSVASDTEHPPWHVSGQGLHEPKDVDPPRSDQRRKHGPVRWLAHRTGPREQLVAFEQPAVLADVRPAVVDGPAAAPSRAQALQQLFHAGSKIV
jgi:hypothetical protein